MTTATARRLGELEWALARLTHPREARRTKRHFGVTVSVDGGRTFTRAYPVDISVAGIALISFEEPKARRFVANLDLENKRIQAAAEVVTVQKGTLRGNIVWRIGARFIEIAREVRALIERFVRHVPLTANVPEQLLAGIFPESVVRAILDEMVKLKRLAPPRRGTQPLVKMTYGGVVHRGQEPFHSVKIESRIVHDEKCTVYKTQAYIGQRLMSIEVIPIDNGLPEHIVPTVRRASPARKVRNWIMLQGGRTAAM